MDIIPREEYFGCPVTAEVICKVDMSAYEDRIFNRKRIEDLKKEFDKKLEEIRDLIIDRLLTESDGNTNNRWR